jgi:hypothetical protein
MNIATRKANRWTASIGAVQLLLGVAWVSSELEDVKSPRPKASEQLEEAASPMPNETLNKEIVVPVK